MILFTESGVYDSKRTLEAVEKTLAKIENAVIPGFYGSRPDGGIQTFSRGGSDITGAIIAQGIKADLYENWTDVSGFMMADPRVVKNPKPIKEITYRELRELAYMGGECPPRGFGFSRETGWYPHQYKKTPMNPRLREP